MGGGSRHPPQEILLQQIWRDKIDNNWYYYDDSNVTQCNEENVCTKAAYVLFYQRRPNSKSQRNIPAAAGSAETSQASSSLHNGNVVNGLNGGGEASMNGVGESDEDMEIN